MMNFSLNLYIHLVLLNLSNYSSAPSNGFSQMARMMDSLILDSLSTPFALTKITTHRPVKKATSSTNLPTANGTSAIRNPFSSSTTINKKIPTQGICI